MTSRDTLRAHIWNTLLQALDTCQATIDLIEELDGGSNELIGEWQELDEAFAHMHNVKRWIGRAWGLGQKPTASPPSQVMDTMTLNREEARALLEQVREMERNAPEPTDQ